jgi:hypothetical protein
MEPTKSVLRGSNPIAYLTGSRCDFHHQYRTIRCCRGWVPGRRVSILRCLDRLSSRQTAGSDSKLIITTEFLLVFFKSSPQNYRVTILTVVSNTRPFLFYVLIASHFRHNIESCYNSKIRKIFGLVKSFFINN